jgi:hypothetical protein
MIGIVKIVKMLLDKVEIIIIFREVKDNNKNYN